MIRILRVCVAGLGCLCLLLGTPVYAATSPLIFELDFESGTLDGWQSVGNPMPKIDSSRTRVGKYGVRSYLTASDPDPETRERVEMKVPKSGEAAKLGSVFWYGWSMYLPSPYPIDSLHWEILTQFHNNPDSEVEHGRNPTLSFQIKAKSDRFTIASMSDPRAISGDKAGMTLRTYDAGRIELDQWIDWVVNVKWSYEADGFLKIWRNGKLVVDARGPTSYNDRLGPYFKLGLYKANWKTKSPDPNVRTRTVYHDEFRMAGANGSFEQVSPGRSNRPTPPALTLLPAN